MTIVASKYERQKNELYQTERYATDALLRHLPSLQGMCVWEPAAGNHMIADVLVEREARVFTSDIAIYDRTHHHIFDFINGFYAGSSSFYDAVITNPPFGKGNRDAVKFCELALKRCSGWVAMLLTEGFDSGKTRTHLFRDNPRFAMKIALLDRIIWFPGGTEGTGDHAWYVWAPVPGIGCGNARMIWEDRRGGGVL